MVKKGMDARRLMRRMAGDKARRKGLDIRSSVVSVRVEDVV